MSDDTARETSMSSYLDAFSQHRGYLDFARSGPPSRDAERASAEAWRRAATTADLDEAGVNHDARCAVGALIGFPVDDIALVSSTSLGLFHVAFALQGAEVLVSRGEFPANLYPWWRAEQLGILRVHDIPGDPPGLAPVTPERVAAALTPTTSVVAVSAVDFRTGHRADFPGIREVIGDRLLIVDGIQAVGALDMPWHHADALIAGGQKWLRAGWGTGFVAVSPRALERMTPTLSGWTGASAPTRYDGVPHPAGAGAAHLALTNGSPVSALVLTAALELIDGVGVPAIAERIARASAHLDTMLRERGVDVVSPDDPADRGGIVVARFSDGSATDRAALLRRRGIIASIHAPDRIRFSVHATTTADEIDEAVAALVDPARGNLE